MDLKTFKNKSNLELMDYLSAKIRRKRKNHNLSQLELAKRANIPVRTFKRFEQNCNGTVDNFINVLRAFDEVNILQFIFNEDSQKIKPNFIDKIDLARKKSLSRD